MGLIFFGCLFLSGALVWSVFSDPAWGAAIKWWHWLIIGIFLILGLYAGWVFFVYSDAKVEDSALTLDGGGSEGFIVLVLLAGVIYALIHVFTSTTGR